MSSNERPDPAGRSPADPVDVLIVARSANKAADALSTAVSEQHPDWTLWAAWAGDPQQRPAAPSHATWVEAAPEEIDLCRVSDDDRCWLAGLTAARELISGRRRPLIVLLAGDAAVAGTLTGLVARSDDGLVVIPRVLGPVANGFPQVAELFRVGATSSSAIGLGVEALPAIDWLLAELLVGDPVDFGRRIDVATLIFPARQCTDRSVGVSAWRWPTDRPARLIDAPHHDPDVPTLLDGDLSGRPRISLADPRRSGTMRSCSDQFANGDSTIRIPGGIPIDAVIRRATRSSAADGLRPWSHASEFRTWLGQHYWIALLDLRPDLDAMFRSPRGVDSAGLRAWADGAAARGEAPLLIDPAGIPDAVNPLEITGCRSDGVNVIGYLDRQSGVGAVGRSMVQLLADAGIPHTSIAYQRTSNPRLASPAPTDQRIDFATTIACVNGDQVANLRDDHPELFGPGQRVIGYWFWELATVAGGPPVAIDAVAEVWAATSFMAQAFAEHDVRVRTVPLPIAEPERSSAPRESFAPFAGCGDRFVFGAVLDHLSVTARKNPLGAIDAFTQAFSPDEGPLLVIKTINGAMRWREHEELCVAAAARPDIVVWDIHLPIADHYAFIGHLDALVSLHRSEGLGLHLAEAMWMHVPVIATRYSGNLDFMDDSCALLVDAELVPVGDLGGWAYPADALWANPDVEHAATLMRRLYDDRSVGQLLADAAVRRMENQPGRRATAELIKSLAGIED